MPSPERVPGGPPPEQPPLPEQEPLPYYRAARFGNEPAAGRVYFRLQDAIIRADCDLSTFRFQLNQVYHVAVLGDQPPTEVDQRLERILAAGQPTTLSSDVLKLLHERRAAAVQEGPWTERHFRPGQPL